jgi:hypothetical protein
MKQRRERNCLEWRPLGGATPCIWATKWAGLEGYKQQVLNVQADQNISTVLFLKLAPLLNVPMTQNIITILV